MRNFFKLGLAFLALAGISSAALAATPGVYVGAGVGYGYGEQQKLKSSDDVSVSQQRGNVAGRVFGGYNFNQNFGLEGGYNYYGPLTSKATDKTGDNFHIKNSTQLQSADLVGKAYLPISDSGFDLYALGGAAYVHSNQSVSGTITDQTTTNKVRPKFGAGVGYAIPDTGVTTSLEVSRIQGTGSNSAIPNIDTAMMTVSYTFDN